MNASPNRLSLDSPSQFRLPMLVGISLLMAMMLVMGRSDEKNKNQKTTPRPVEIPDLNTARQMRENRMDGREGLNLLVAELQKTDDANLQRALLNGILLGLDGQRDVPPPTGWSTLAKSLERSPNDAVRNLTGKLSQVFGDEVATLKALALVQNRSAPIQDRQSALVSLVTQRRKDLVPILKDLLDEDGLRISAIRAYGAFDSPEAPSVLLGRYSNLPEDAKKAVVETLTTRKAYAEALFAALESGQVPREAIPAYLARSMSSILGEKFAKKYGVKKLSEDREAQIEKYGKLATSKALSRADASRGRAVYQRVCMVCHQMYGEGGIVGPDLTGSNRADLNYLLLNLLDPSGDIPDAYRMVVVTTKNDQVLTGTVTAEDDNKIELSTIGEKATIAKNDIKSRIVSPLSMMPEGLLQSLKDQEVLDLFKYMKTKAQVDLPK